jgi:hypothetical protein
MMTVMAKTPVTDENGKTKEKITAFLVTPDLPGFEVVSKNRSKCGIRGTWQATLKFTDMPVPRDRVLGEVGKGLKVALGVLDYGRCTLSVGCVGGAKKLLELSIERAKSRRQFDRSIAEFQLIKQKIARMTETTFAMDALTYLAAGLVDRHLREPNGPDIMLETAIAKLFCSEGLWQIADDAMQIWGGEGYMRENGIERMFRDARINRIVEGATEVMTAFVALVGMKGVGEQFEQVLRYTKHPIGNFGPPGPFRPRPVERRGDRPRIRRRASGIGTRSADPRSPHQPPGARRRPAAAHVQAGHHRHAVDPPAHRGVGRAALRNGRGDQQASIDARTPRSRQRKWKRPRPFALRRDLLIGKSFCHRAAGEISANLHSLFKNRDEEILAVADAAFGPRG